jgi:large subunit GTPase 1
MPKFAASRAEMVIAGVIPIDRLTDMRGPVGELAARVGRPQVRATRCRSQCHPLPLAS